MDVKQLIESSNDFQTQSSTAKKLVAKWEKTGLLEGKDMNTAYAKEHMAIILENQAKRLLIESSQTNLGGATFTAGAGDQWAGVALPLVRKVFAEISAKEFMSVQPMTLPTGLVFFLEFKYGNTNPTTGGLSRFVTGDSLYGTTNVKDVDPYGGLYGAGRYGYSSNDYTASVTFAITSGSLADVNFNSAYSASVAAARIRVFSVTTASVNIPNLDTLAVRSFVITGSGFSEGNSFAEFAGYNSTADIAFFVVSASNGGVQTSASLAGTVYYSIQTKDNNRGDFEDRETRPLTGSSTIPEINVELRSETVAAKTKKLKAKWTPEFSQDLNAYQSLDAEAELTSTISEYVSMEIDLELIDMVIAAANTTDVWSALSNRFYNKNTGLFEDRAVAAGGYYQSQGGWYQTLGTKIQGVARTIHAKTLRGQANVMMCGPKVSTIIESIPGYAADTDGSKMEYAMGTQKIGSLNSRYKVIVNPYMQENVIALAYKGGQFLETGAAFCPYIPLIMTPLVYDPETFTPRKGLMTRYAKKVLRPEFFGKVFVSDLNLV